MAEGDEGERERGVGIGVSCKRERPGRGCGGRGLGRGRQKGWGLGGFKERVGVGAKRREDAKGRNPAHPSETVEFKMEGGTAPLSERKAHTRGILGIGVSTARDVSATDVSGRKNKKTSTFHY